MPFNVCVTCIWESLVLGCAFYYRSVIKEKTPTKKTFPLFLWTEVVTFIVSEFLLRRQLWAGEIGGKGVYH